MATSRQTALYHVHGKSDLLYIGVSNNFGRRWTEHAQKQPWWNNRQRMTVDWYNTRDEALDAEALAIFTEQPQHNVLHRKQAQRLRRLRRQYAIPVAPTITPQLIPEEIARLNELETLEIVRGMQERAAARAARRTAGTWTEQERKDYEYMCSLNSGLGGADLT